MGTNHKIINGDCRDMSLIPDSSVRMVVTSPPYWQLKDYGSEDQIGFHSNYEDYINNLDLVWNECYRVLHDGCRLCINIGDQFARSVYYGRYKVIPIRTEIIKFCESIGFDYMGAIIWQKVTTSNSTGGGVQMGSYPYPRNGIIKLDYEFILIFKKLGEAPKPSMKIKELSKMTPDEWNTYFSGHWHFPGAKQTDHMAMFPEELPHRLIKMFSFAEDTILDPFLGSGTTILAAKHLKRNSIGYEINTEFLPIIREKIGVDSLNIDKDIFEFVKLAKSKKNFKKEIESLPYIFKDPLHFNNKVDMKRLQFGSVIDKNSQRQRTDLYVVKEILGINKLKLDNDIVVRLIGVKEDPRLEGKAMEYLRSMIKGKRVFLKYDKIKYDTNNLLMCYVYLENKTFVNAHIIKDKMALVEEEEEFKYKTNFNKYING